MDGKTNAYAHRLVGDCLCGVRHDKRPTPVPALSPTPLGPIIKVYDYNEASGELQFQVTRHDPKDFRQRRRGEDGTWVWNIQGARRVLYRLPEIAGADPADPVIVLEGERDADTAAALEYCSTTTSGGALNSHHTDLSPLYGRHIVLVPDIDPPTVQFPEGKGQRHMRQIATALDGKAASIRIVTLPAHDFSDFISGGGTAEGFQTLIDSAKILGEPEPAPAYCFEPSTINPYVNEFITWREKASDAPLEYAEALAIGVLAAVVGPHYRLPIRQSAYPVKTGLFIALLGGSTVYRKSHSLETATELIREIRPDALMDSPGSPEGFVQDLARHEETGAVLSIDECAWWLNGMKKKAQMSDLKGYIMRAYDGTPISRRLRDKRGSGGSVVVDADIAKDPMLTILAGSTPDRMAAVSTREDVEDGYWPRWIIVWPTSRPPLRHLGPPDPEIDRLRKRIVDTLYQVLARVGPGVGAALTSEAWKKANNAEERLTHLVMDNEDAGAFYGRGELRILKIAALLALVDDLDGGGIVMVQPHHVEDADALVTKWLGDAQRFSESIGLNEFEGSLQRALAALKRKRIAARRDIARVAHVPARVMDEIENTLLDRGLITVVDGSRGNKEWALT